MPSNKNNDCTKSIKNKYLKIKKHKLNKDYITISKNQFLELQKYKLKHELKVIRDNDYDREFALRNQHNQNVEGHLKEVKKLIFNGIKHGIIDDDIYDILLSEYYLFTEILEDSKLKDVCIAAIKNAPYDLSAYQTREAGVASAVYEEGVIGNIFTRAPQLIPSLLEVISYSSKDKISISQMHISYIEESLKGNAKKAIAKYCTKNDDGSYDIEPHYLLPIKDNPHFKELKQCFKDIYDTIDSNDLDKAKDSLKQIKENVSKYNIDVDSIVKALCCLANEAKSNEAIAYAICGLAGDITYPTDHLGSVSISSNTNKEQERTH